MEPYLVVYFFIILIFLRGIFKELKLLVFISISIALLYAYTSYNRSNISNNLVNNSTDNKINIHSYGNISYNKTPLHANNLQKVDFVKDELNKLDLDNQTKIEIYSNVKKFLEIYENFEIYDYNKNYLDDLTEQQSKILNMISSLNISLSNNDKEVHYLFKLVDNFMNSYLGKFKNANTYNFLEHPRGYEKNNFDLF